MRNLTMIVLAAASLAGGCKWTEFDDLEKEAWVSSTGKPNGDSSDYGVAIQRGSKASASGGKLVVIGAGQAQYTELVYAPNGDSDLAPTALKLNVNFGIGNLESQPILLADPSNDEVSLVVNAGGQTISVLTGSGGLVPHNVFGPTSPDAAAYVQPPNRTDVGHAGEAQPLQPLIGSVDTVYGTYFANTPNPQPKTQLMDDLGAPIQIRALAGARINQVASDDLVVWTATGKLALYDGKAGWDPAVTMTGPLTGSTAVDTGFAPGKGSQLIVVDGKFALLVGHRDMGDAASFLAVYDVTAGTAGARTPARIGNPITIPELRTAAVLDLGAKGRFVVAGYPTSTFDGVKAGRVLVFPLSTTSGIAETPAMTLNDAEPEADQAFGRAIAVMTFNGQPTIAVGADNEVFVYYRTLLYDETRQGQ